MAVAVARPPFREHLAEANAFADGWSSRLLQRVLARILQDDGLAAAMDHARSAYQEWRHRECESMNLLIRGRNGSARPGSDGVDVWVQERSALGGVRIADGEPFFVNPGRVNLVRRTAPA
jgi:DNA-binding transcriptional MocR family regulator